MALTGFALMMHAGAPESSEAGVIAELPERAGNYQGHVRLFCQNESCMRSFLVSELRGNEVCPVCGGKFEETTLGEHRLLPVDTVVKRKEYIDAFGRMISVTIVLSGREQKSIHRPQQCLPAQGYVIEGSKVIPVPIGGRAPLYVMLLDMRKTGTAPGGGQRRRLYSFGYWFVGADRETPYHLQRLFWMSVDRIFRNVNHRWAYIAVSTERREGADEHIKRLGGFIAELYSLIMKQGT